MGIQVGVGQLTVDADDPQVTFRGKRVAIKIRDFGSGNVIIVGCKLDEASGQWQGAVAVYQFDDQVTPEMIVERGISEWLQTAVVPAINEWLLVEFPAAGTPLTPLELIFAGTQMFRWNPQPDGTLQVTI